MLEDLTAILVGTLLLGLATWQAARVLSDGSILAGVRNRLTQLGITTIPGSQFTIREDTISGRIGQFFADLLGCRLCLNTQVAVVFTWGALAVGLLSHSNVFSSIEWGFAFVVGPFLVAGWTELIRRLEA